MKSFGTAGFGVSGGVTAPLSSALWWPSGVLWAWDAANNRFMLAGLPVSKAQAIGFTRASVAYKLVDQVWVPTAINEIRQEKTGVRLEPAATNYLRWSNDFSQAPWTKTGTATIETTTIDGPISGKKAYRLNSNGQVGLLLDQAVNGTNPVVGEVQAGSLMFKGEGANIGKILGLQLKRQSGTFAGTLVEFVLSDEWQRPLASYVPVTGSLGINLSVLTGSVVGTAANSCLICHAQAEKGAVSSSPIDTTTAAATRSADVLIAKFSTSATFKIKYSPDWRKITNGETLTINGLKYIQHRSTAASYAIETAYQNSGILRFEVHNGDRPDFDTPGKDRSEILTGTRYAKSVSVWVSKAMKIESGFVPSASLANWFIVGQWHGDSDVDGRTPYFAISLYGNDLHIIGRRWTGTVVNEVAHFIIPNFPRDQWQNIVVEHKTDQTNGILNVWINGTQVVSYAGQFGYWDQPFGGYWKDGIYRSPDTQIGVAYLQNLEEGTSSLAARIASPLALDEGKQDINAVPSAGQFTLDSALLTHNVISMAVAA